MGRRLSSEERQELEAELDKAGLELYLVRGLKSQVEGRDETLKSQVKQGLLTLGTERYEGANVVVEVRSKSHPRQVDPQTASRYVPFADFLMMVRVDREKFEAYLAANDIDLPEGSYLVSPGSYSYVPRPEVKLPQARVRTEFQRLYEALVNLVTTPKTKKKTSRKKK